MAAIDRNAEALGVPRRLLMESSGNAVARAVRGVAAEGDQIDIIAGRGNNGGDGFAAARFLSGFDVKVTLLGHSDRITTDIAAANWEVVQKGDTPHTIITDSTSLDGFDGDVIVDAILGTGVRGEIREPLHTAIKQINHSEAQVISVDIPSGVDPDTGEDRGSFVDADRVVTFHDRMPAHEHLEVPIIVEDIGIPTAAERFVGPGDLASVQHRRDDAHKGDFGEILVIGGGPYVGAPALSALASLRAGADLVHLAIPEVIADAVTSYHPEFIPHRLPGSRLEQGHVERLLEIAEEVDVVIIGPGLGASNGTMEAIEHMLNALKGPVVVDADALECLPKTDSKATIVATPHAGEFEAMGFTRPTSWREGMNIVSDAAQSLDCTIVLKGRNDIISDGESTRVNRTGNPGMTTGGTGDVLTGAIGAMLARKDAFEAACIGTWINGTAGDLLAEEHPGGYLASEVADAIPFVMMVDD